MAEQTLMERVEILEKKLEVLELLSTRVGAVELQILQLRDEVRVEFSAIRDEMKLQMGALTSTLREEIRAGDEDTRRYMRVLHEEVISRIATIQEGRRPRKR